MAPKIGAFIGVSKNKTDFLESSYKTALVISSGK
jgi:hypothetical protein